MHASPSLPSQRDSPANQVDFPQLFNSPTPTQASSSPQQKAQQQSPERPSQPHTPLTPPLTPASSASMSGSGFVSGGESNVAASNPSLSAFSTPARGPAAPPPTPASIGLLSGSNLTTSHMGPPSPIAVGTTSGTNGTAGSRWPAPSEQRRMRPLPHRLDVGTIGNVGPGVALSSHSERSERSDLERALPDADRVVTDFRSADADMRGDASGGERFLLVGNIPKDATEEQLRDAFSSLGDIRGTCVRYQETEGIIILAFFECRCTMDVERKILAPGQTYFGGRRLRVERMGSAALTKLMGDDEFIKETEGEVVATADGNIDANSLQSIISSFGELRAFSQATLPNGQAYIAEFFDCRNAKSAMEALNGRSIFGIRLCLVPRHAASAELTGRIPFPLSSENTRQIGRGGSQPTSPLVSNNSFGRMYPDGFSLSSHQEHPTEMNEASVSADTSNSSPFHGPRALPLVSPLSHSHSITLHAGGGRRISTGSVSVLPGLHQSTSEQDLRRRAAVNNVSGISSRDGWITDHARRTSDTFCFDALRRVAGDLSGNVAQAVHGGMGNLARPRARAISESSASPRVVSPSEGFSTAGMDVGLPGKMSYNEPSTPEHSTSNGASSYYREDRDRGSEPEHSSHVHSRIPTVSDSSLGGPHTPSPGPVSYNVAPYFATSPSVLGIPGMLAPPHHGTGHCYLGSPLGAATNPAGMRYGYSPQSAGYSPGGLSVHSAASSPSSLHSPSHASLLYSPSNPMHVQLHSSARGALGVTRDPPSERNQIDLERIAAGLDTRTTVMIKNIPNKLTDKDLNEYIGRVCPRKIDFLYLRMDFQNGCNVGYAFVNFIQVQDLLHFARSKLGIKWNMYSSEKVLQMSYANYQGKEALIEKFKNSCVMDERESWRPKIFYSSGPNQGLLEPFPAPTHFRRKERSAQNRGALFLHSAHSHGSNTGGEGRGAGSGMLGTPFRRHNQHPQNLARQERF
ncbi:hypothetical protein ACEPAH_6762 [Sanghuangporus vaninii]